MASPNITVVEVGPRDGFQVIASPIATDIKIEHIRRLHACGLRRIEVTAFVSPRAVPQMADAPEVLAVARTLPGLATQVLAPTAAHALRAAECRADRIAFVMSASEALLDTPSVA